ncbi:DNA polymerase III subunit chi [Sutterella wadsworthensis]|uniref:DNA polymerase III subunit chi n=1 Tax=Sutterella wadsworthensis TaxID=40545 RepID=UPI00307AB3AE
MQKIDFHFNVPSRLRYACLVARTVYKRGLTLAMWSSETKKLTELDELLWRFDDLAFLPHVFADDRHAAETPIILSTQLPQLTGDVLVLLDDALPTDWQKEFGRFSRIIDVVSTEPTELKLSRDRWRAYKAAGVELAAYDRRK